MERKPVLLVAVPSELHVGIREVAGPRPVEAVDDVPSARAVAGKSIPSAAVIALDGTADPERLELVRELAGGGVPVLVLGGGKDPEAIRESLRAGARDFIAGGEEQELPARIAALLEASGDFHLAQVTAFMPAKGGMGATSLASHLAGALARQGRRTCLVDLDFEMGDALSFLDLAGSYSLADVAGNAHRIDRELLDASVPRHGSGVWVLSQCEKVADVDRLDAGTVAGVLRFLRHHYDHLILDGLRDFGDVPLAAMDLSTRIVLVVTQEIPAVRSAQRCAAYFRQLGYDPSRILLVLNRNQRSSPITREVIEETVGLPVSSVVGNDFAGLSRAVNRGVLLWDEAPRSVVARDVEALAATLDAPVPAQPQAGFLKRIFAPRAVAHGTE